MRTNILGIPFDVLTPGEAVDRGFQLMGSGGGRVVTPNPEIVMVCRKNPEAREAVVTADLILADGIGILKAAKSLGRPLQSRVLGVEWTFSMLARCAETGKTVFFLGGKPGVAALAAEKAAERFPNLTVLGVCDGYFTDDEEVV
ncbi:MAG: WecB/TagA/CpsF family glycosyltransferase, partial [Oscillospiraceae bacterium]|nr:WecB/TagA/CpsF family glycosyltransferase [Oscillospiraceae bacterium]